MLKGFTPLFGDINNQLVCGYEASENITRKITGKKAAAAAGRRVEYQAEMPEHPATDSSATDNTVTVKRYAPPNQRNRALGRRKSGGDRLERG
ncbi:hypothetical protein HAX54_007704 [Datura stramonium]|uniref:Uncharacterized protein n=1 Tax=Datura stramonium TaxID=4076 RepID=A0ABS8WUT7_DATST|nr:hypothetical protein [Datura stramonium]